MKKFSITTLGCKVNQCESESIAQQLREKGYAFVQDGEKTDISIINTCTVTQKAAMQSRQAVRRAHKINSGGKIIVTGCYAQTQPEVLLKIKGVTRVVGQANKHRIPQIISDEKNNNSDSFKNTLSQSTGKNKFRRFPVSLFGKRTRPFLRIQDGCNSFCTYCIVPFSRGKSCSMPPESVLDGIRDFKKSGYHEVVLTGIHLGQYGRDLTPQYSLFDLLKRICDLDLIGRIRLSSIEPGELTENIIEFVHRTNKICQHFHIPLQSGDDGILKRMGRPYNRDFFKSLILKIRKTLPEAAIGVDVLVGFPGESQEAFSQTYSLIKDLPVTYLHVFPFSPRRGTKAYSFEDKVQSTEVKKRSKKMRNLGNLKKAEFCKLQIGTEHQVLIEEKRDISTGLLNGLTSNYIRVHLEGDDQIKNTLVNLKIEKLTKDGLVIGTIRQK